MTRQHAWIVVSRLLAAWLFTAATLKGWAYFHDPKSLPPIPLAKVAWPVLIGAELLAATTLALGARRYAAQLYPVTVAGFTVLACVAAWFTWLRLPSCGCFGAFAVPPAVTLLLDLLIVVALRYCRPDTVSTTAWLKGVAVGAFLGAGVVTGLALAAPARLTTETPLPVEGGFVIVEPSGWAGQRLPLLDYLESDVTLTEGSWTLLLVHHNCPHCAATISRLVNDSPPGVRIVLVQVPPYGDWPAKMPNTWRRARLTDRFQWYVSTPLIIEIEGGRVGRVELRESLLREGQAEISPARPGAGP